VPKKAGQQDLAFFVYTISCCRKYRTQRINKIEAMSNETTPPSKQKTIIRGAILALILVVLPAISYFYMKSGYQLRKEAVGVQANFGKIRSVAVIYPDGKKEDQIKGKVCVIHLFGEAPDLTDDNRKILDTCEKLFNQFGSNPFFRLTLVAKEGTAEFRSHYQKMPSSDYVTWAWTGALGSWRTIIENGYESFYKSEKVDPVKEYFAVCDTSGQIRRYYNALDDKEIDRMVQHIAILLPPPPPPTQ
jgi:hypothetical protein